MICPKDAVQMRQKYEYNEGVGGGIATDEQYVTWELKECPICERLVVEFYAALPVKDIKGALDVAVGLTEPCYR